MNEALNTLKTSRLRCTSSRLAQGHTVKLSVDPGFKSQSVRISGCLSSVLCCHLNTSHKERHVFCKGPGYSFLMQGDYSGQSVCSLVAVKNKAGGVVDYITPKGLFNSNIGDSTLIH